MELDSILVPTDGSQYTARAIDMAVMLAKLSGAKVTAVYVVDRAAASALHGSPEFDTVTEALNHEGNLAVDEVRKACESAGVPVDTRILAGNPAEAINDASKDYDMIVMSSIGRSGVSKYLIGSVAEKVVKGAKCPVTVIRT